MDYITDIHRVDAARIQLLIDASIQAYNAFDSNHPSRWRPDRVTPPDGFELIDYWTGVDAVFGYDKTVEVYGLVFRSTASPGRYLFAFRGTDSFLDALDDLGMHHQVFRPFNTATTVPSDVLVEGGFQDVYRAADGSVSSMQQQVFALLDNYRESRYPVEELLVTGHSLGAALSTLFMLDVALSRPDVSARLVNFASPRVGNHHFIPFYEQHVEKAHEGPRSLRLQNVYDKVPCVPFERSGYAHLREACLIAFYPVNHWKKYDVIGCHSSLAYRGVIACATESSDGMCTNHHLQIKGQTDAVHSKKPDPKEICRLW